MRVATGGILAVLVAVVALPHPAEAEVALGGELLAEEACQAFHSIRNQTNPGAVLTVPGARYVVRGLNKPNGEWVHVVVPDAEPADRWVNRACGTLSEAPDPEEPEPIRPVPSGFRPFFDTVDGGPDDMTPPPPPLDAFDRAVLEVCGPWGSVPKVGAFRAMLDRPDLAADVEAIYEALDRSVTGRATDPSTFRDELTRVWFDQAGFAHIFCGEPGTAKLGGLHYRGRYLQLQEQGLAGLLTPEECRITEIEPPVYTFGVAYRTPTGRVSEDCPKGYPLDLNARDLLIQATMAFKGLAGAGGKQMCLKEVDAGPGPDYLAVFVIKSGAIRTFYPDATPQCDDRNAPVSRCACPG